MKNQNEFSNDVICEILCYKMTEDRDFDFIAYV